MARERPAARAAACCGPTSGLFAPGIVSKAQDDMDAEVFAFIGAVRFWRAMAGVAMQVIAPSPRRFRPPAG